jgi:hypothetical protein
MVNIAQNFLKVLSLLLAIPMAFSLVLAINALLGKIEGLSISFDFFGKAYTSSNQDAVLNSFFFFAIFSFLGLFFLGAQILEKMIKRNL